jgi:carboxyl-terminal processing protease
MSSYTSGKKITLLFVLILSLFCLSVCSDDKDKYKLQMASVLLSLNKNQYDPPKIDDQFSEKVYGLYLGQLDYSKKFLIREDSLLLASYKIKIDDELNGAPFDFFEKSNDIYEKRLQWVASFYKDYLASPYDFTNNEIIQIDAEKRPFAKDESEMKEQWRKYLKYQVMVNLQIKLAAEEKGDTSSTRKSFDVLEKEARAKVQKEHEDMFRRLQRETKDERFADFANAVVHVFDPHSDFFPPKDKENFDIRMSGKLEGIGATLQEKDGYIKVMSIVPGSPSYKQGELKPEDFILKVGQEDEEPVDIVDMRLDNAVQLIRGKKGTTVKLTIKKPDGNIHVIAIVRDVVVMEESYAKSVIILDEKNKQRIGFISLPSFYADFNNRNGRTCSDDVKKELLKLKEDKVDGVVLDLRNNGGGSLSDVIKMGGFFIAEGPIVQIKGTESIPSILGDEDPSVVYDGPLVILVNQFSASASEILAAAMQDYRRAIIIGSNASFGKGTVQRFYELPAPKGTEDLGSIKITTQKFYRINGGSTQLKGVIPDIILPDLYRYLNIGEKEMKYAMPWDKIQATSYTEWNKKSLPVKSVQVKSKARIDKNETFQQIDKNAHYLKHKQEHTNYPLNLKTYQAELQTNKKEEDRMSQANKEIAGWDFTAVKADVPLLTDTVKTSRNKEFIKMLKKDIYLYEAVQVIKDIRK